SRRGHLERRRQIRPELEAVQPSLRIALRHFLVKDAAAGSHPLHVASAEIPAIPQAVTVLNRPGEHIRDRLDSAMGMPREAREVVVRLVVAEVIEEKKRVVIGGIAKAERPAQLDPGAFEGGLGQRNALDGSDGHGAAPFSDGIFEVYDAHNGVSVPYWRAD